MMENQLVTEFLVVGAGPVGLFTALLLARAGRSVRIIDRATAPNTASFALALHPKVVELLSNLEVHPDFLQQGRAINKVVLRHEANKQVTLNLKNGGGYPLAVFPQCQLEQLLLQQLEKYHVHVQWGRELREFLKLDAVIEARIVHLEESSQGYATSSMVRMETGEEQQIASVVLAADGVDSMTRELIGCNTVFCSPSAHFAVFEFEGGESLPDEFQVVFGKEGQLSALWPMPQGRARWSFQVPSHWQAQGPFLAFEQLVKERAPWFSAHQCQVQWHGKVGFGFWHADPFVQNGVFLLGDAAHQTHPFGIQSMNNALIESYNLCQQLLESETAFSLEKVSEDYSETSRQCWTDLLTCPDQWKEKVPGNSWLKEFQEELMKVLPISYDQLSPALDRIKW